MSDSDKTINDLAAQYLDLWQKQMTSPASMRAMEDAIKTANGMGEQAGEMFKSLDSPQKVQDWMTSWAESWKAQFEDDANPFSAFTNVAPFGAQTPGAPSKHDQRDVDELEKRLKSLEERVHSLESRLKDGG